jgi:hypothetical protein
MAECNRDWKTCPVHGLPEGKLPPMNVVVLCLYGGLETKSGTPFDADDANDAVERVFKRLLG